MSDKYETCGHDNVDIVDRTRTSNGYHMEGAIQCSDCDCIWLFEAGPE